MTLAEWWLVYDARRPPVDKVKPPTDYDYLYELAFGDEEHGA